MRIVCLNGFYKFYPQNIAEVRRFQVKYGKPLVQCKNYFTFPILAELPEYSFFGQNYSGSLPALVNYAGKKEEVLSANGYTFYQPSQGLVLKGSFLQKMNYSFSNFFHMDNLPQAFNYDDIGIITGFNGFVDVDYMIYKIERFFYEDI
tara:strand:- start:2193 stop:2636 length:444 start_codon:yes stop_codon:yes gene_type:complete